MKPDSTAPDRVRALADTIATHVERGDWDAIRPSLAPGCRAEWFGTALEGEGVVEHAGREWARLQQEFDERRIEPRVEPAGPDGAEIRFTEYLMKMPGLWHRRRWRMTLRFDGDTRVKSLAFTQTDADRDAYANYRARCGLPPDARR